MIIKHRRIAPLRPSVAVVGMLFVTIVQLQSRSPNYLSGVGPPTLRFDTSDRGQVIPTEFSFNESKPPVPAKVDAPATPVLASATNTTLGTASDPNKNSPDTNSLASVAKPLVQMDETPQTSGDLSIVTPMMVLEYLKPLTPSGGAIGKGAAVIPAVKIDFTPPVRANNSSTAVYKRE